MSTAVMQIRSSWHDVIICFSSGSVQRAPIAQW